MVETQEEEARLLTLREAGKGWPESANGVPAAPAGQPDLTVMREVRGARPGDRFVRVARAGHGAFRTAGPGAVRATAAIPRARGPLGRLVFRGKELVVGSPLANERAPHERLTKVKALAVLSSDPISSVAYATGAMLSVLLVAGTRSFNVSLGIAAAIATLLAIVILSYRQTIKAYPHGGGSYIVASANLGALFGLIAGSSLMIDYVLTVAVSVTQGVANIVSLAPGLAAFTLVLDLSFILILLFGNLRGIRESGTIFMLPSYLFIIFVYLMIVVGGARFFAGGAHVLAPHVLPGVTPVKATESLSLFLILRAFAGGCTALTGVEAISDGVPAFQPPEWRNARTTLTTLGVLSISMFAGITLLVHAYGLVPNPGDSVPTLISQLNSTILGNGIGFYYGQIVTALILLLAANTAFSDFPRLAFFMARDSFLPHQFKHRGDRLSYSNGILILTLLATLLIVRYWSDTSQLFNLYVIGVFASFTLSQAGMVRRWWLGHEEGRRKGIFINGLGAAVTAVVLCITAVTKFTSGAWLVVLLVPLMVTVFYRIRAHYRDSARSLIPRAVTSPDALRHILVVSAFGDEEERRAVLAYLKVLHPDRVVIVEPARSITDTDLLDRRDEETGAWVRVSAASAFTGMQAATARERSAAPDSYLTVLTARNPGRLIHDTRCRRLRRVLLRRHGAVVIEVTRGAHTRPAGKGHTTLVSVAALNQSSLEALAYSRSLFLGRVLAVHVAAEDDRERVRREWDAWGNHLPLVNIDSPFRAIVAPLCAYIDAVAEHDDEETIAMVLPLVLARGLLGRVLHNHTANRLRRLLLGRANTVVVSVPHRLP
jgi:amino acid transporter